MVLVRFGDQNMMHITLQDDRTTENNTSSFEDSAKNIISANNETEETEKLPLKV